jgi:antitoxin HigA-1
MNNNTVQTKVFKMKNPPHPGLLVREIIESNGLTITKVATAIGVSRPNLSEIVNCRAGISLEMAMRLSKYFGSSLQLWRNVQARYDESLVNNNPVFQNTLNRIESIKRNNQILEMA